MKRHLRARTVCLALLAAVITPLFGCQSKEAFFNDPPDPVILSVTPIEPTIGAGWIRVAAARVKSGLIAAELEVSASKGNGKYVVKGEDGNDLESDELEIKKPTRLVFKDVGNDEYEISWQHEDGYGGWKTIDTSASSYAFGVSEGDPVQYVGDIAVTVADGVSTYTLGAKKFVEGGKYKLKTVSFQLLGAGQVIGL